MRTDGDAYRATIPMLDPGAAEIATAGRKGASLAMLLHAGLPVHPGVIVTTRVHAGRAVQRSVGDVEDLVDTAAAEIEAELGRGPLAVRSSAVAEDMIGRSHAGLYRTFLGVQGAADIARAVRECWDSASGACVYGEQGTDDAMAVLVQRMLEPVAAGAAFAPTGADARVSVSAVRGIGADLMSGVADADEWTVAGTTVTRVRSICDAVDEDQVRSIAALARTVARVTGEPVEIEWALTADGLVLLQSRPMTALPPDDVRWQAGQRGQWRRDIRLGEWLPEPVTPLFASWVLPIVDSRFRDTQRERSGVAVPRPAYVLCNGWYFHSSVGDRRSSVLFRGMVTHPRFAFGMLLGRRTPWLSRRLLIDAEIEHFERVVHVRQRAALADARARLGTADDAELVEIVDRLVAVFADHVWPMVMLGGAAWRSEDALARFFAAHLATATGGTHHALLDGTGVAGLPAHAVSTLDWYHPTMGELGISMPEPTGAASRANDARELTERCTRVLPARRRRRFHALVAAARDTADRRTNCASEMTRQWPLMRQAIRALGESLTSSGLIAGPDDVFFLQIDELRAAVSGSPADGLQESAAERRKTCHLQSRLRPPTSLGIPAALLRYLLPPASRPTPPSADILNGIGVSPGRATGRARFLDHATPAQWHIDAGDILVVRAFVPALAPLLARAGGIASEVGSIAAHMSVLSREFGVPGVVGLSSITETVRDGDVITIDGTHGSVIIGAPSVGLGT